MREEDLIRKLVSIEALFAGATTEGERDAAGLARQRILKRLRETEKVDPPVEYKFSLADEWSRKLFLALLRRYGIRPYRYRRQRYTTVMAKMPKSFVDKTLWPEYSALDDALQAHLAEVTNRIISESIHEQHSEAEVEQDERGPLRLR